MIISIKNKEIELKFTFNSFKYMKDFDVSQMALLETKPFMVVDIAESLLLGAVNNDIKQQFSIIDVQKFLEKYVEVDGESLPDLVEELMVKLQESNFFKSLQKTNKNQ